MRTAGKNVRAIYGCNKIDVHYCFVKLSLDVNDSYWLVMRCIAPIEKTIMENMKW